ncbi:AMP-binding protein [Oceanihabitans sediminis]|uniref:O-succinylbenzoic acid--CoA ligase n=1 Tax=Oceanihabitans sediminis TaxID=1812012 RepID=A0A368P6A1_9FLAO|nr:AMP-binding protein [Oceanihabitans sediminis]MDX1277914.1 AMP-binding protein [Oceanihabitans sediminis]MDX1773402.1 AMP-binding protein [Oceanihabitans sediminis]RBP32858.1 O-succinylbenzoic acid--CoA ligase [Oceanihabitans sediminis]RCU57614.1 O-succinylbenzoic acid--CoA ligase [Oceanihabitans sediminis]
MEASYKEIHESFKINGSSYSFEELKEVAYSHVKHGLPFEKVIGDFLIDWLDDKDYVLVKTSGSTGTPKSIKLKKEAMVNSAIATGAFFHLKPKDKALLCLPADYIAGKMMLVRAMVLGLEIDLIEPTSLPVFDTEKYYEFCAMIPLQLQKTKVQIYNMKTIIVGGAAVSPSLKAAIQNVKANIYETYGMTETITHIAVKKINNLSSEELATSNNFKILPNVNISQDDRNCLVIEAPKLSKEKIITNDVVKLHAENSFEWLGRYDNVINSGGVKLFPEQIEAKLAKTISGRFFITKEADAVLGERLILVLESTSNTLEASVFEGLDKFEVPKKIYAIEKFIESANGKVLRHETIKALK